MLCYDVYCKICAEIDSRNVAFEYFTKKCIDVAKMVCYDKCCKYVPKLTILTLLSNVLSSSALILTFFLFKVLFQTNFLIELEKKN